MVGIHSWRKLFLPCHALVVSAGFALSRGGRVRAHHGGGQDWASVLNCEKITSVQHKFRYIYIYRPYIYIGRKVNKQIGKLQRL